MKRFLWIPAAALVAMSACERSPSDAGEDIVSVQVMPDERVLAVGETLTLDAVVRDKGGEEPDEARLGEMEWSSSSTAVATVSAEGVVTGVAPGTATIRAELDGVEGTVQVTVAAAPQACSVPAAVRSLEVGGSVVLGGVQSSTICVDGGVAGREYVAVPFHAGALGAGSFQVRFSGQNIVPASFSSGVAPSLTLAGGREQDPRFHEQLRERAGGELATHVDAALGLRAAREGMRPSLALDLRSPTVGQQVQVNTALSSCGEPSNRTARVAAVGARSIVLADVSNPAGGLTDAEYASFAAGFDTLVYPLVTQNFGVPGDVDENSRVAIFYTSAVNALTPQGSSAYVGGFFHPRDLFPLRDREGLSACASSNFAEMFYMLVPDPQGTVNGNAFSRELVLQTSLGTVAHEFQHLINASRRLYVVGTTNWNEQTWLNEALSHVTEEILFYHVAGLAPRQNIGADQIQGNPRRTQAYTTYMDQNIRRYQRYLEEVEVQSPYDSGGQDENDLATRGAGWAFLRYAADRRTGSDVDLWHDLVEGSTTGFANLQQALGRDPRPLVRDWTVSVFADDVVPNLDVRYTQPSWRFRSFFGVFPLLTRQLASDNDQSFSLNIKSGTASFVRFGVLPAQVASLTARTSGGEALPSSMYVTVLRTK